MIEYHVQKGDTIAGVTGRLNTTWETLRKNNPQSIGKAKNGNWFLREGATVSAENSFDKSLQKAQETVPTATAGEPIHISQQQVKLMHSISTAPEQVLPPTPETDNTESITHTIKAGETLWDLAVNKYHVHVKDIMKDNGITDPKTLRIGQQLTIRLPQSTGEEPVVASWYGEAFHGRPMANGDIYDMHAATIAHKEMPLGTKVELKNAETGEMVRAIVTDRGPYIKGRDVDLSYGLAQKLSLVKQGIGNLTMRVL
jgi:peptidoglycan lytic transglycosylase